MAEILLEPSTAQKLLDALEEAIFSLEELPQRGAPRKNGAYANKGYRQLFVKNFTVIYRVDAAKKQIVIVTVRYSKSQF
ncbi:type II toxin-antitoxin system RelE/ParE family toxin [Pelotomaculum schinkii]|uniref:type II toxin-antitoxin system RelE/ParE family toxin n=1 Tax=Pelotomaculum schinkii TaxID=78350 RepID=UPI0019617E70